MSRADGDGAVAARNGVEAVAARVTEGGSCRRTMEVTVPRDYFERRRASVAADYASRVKLKGFRKGRVPRSVIDRRFGSAIDREALDRSMGRACAEVLESKELAPVSGVDITDVHFPTGGPLTFRASFEVRPSIALGRIGGFRVTRRRFEVAEGAVDRVIERLRRERATWRREMDGKAKPGDQVEVAVTPLDGAPGGETETREYDLVLGEGSALPELEEAIAALEVGEEGDFEVAFPDDFPDSSRRGTARRMRVALLARRSPELPDADDHFARSLGGAESLDDLRERVSRDLEREARLRAESEIDRKLLGMVIEANPFDAPGSMVDQYAEALIADAPGIGEDEADAARDSLRPAAEYAVKHDLMIRRLADEHGLHPTEAEIERAIEEVARGTGEDPGRVRARLAETDGVGALARQMTQRRVYDLLRSRSEVSDAP